MRDDLHGAAVRADTMRLLGPDDPEPVAVVNPSGRSPFLLVGDHAGDALPAALGTLGLAAADRMRHIALDIGTRGLGEALAARLDAVFVHQRYSRLVVDCNRDPASDDAMAAASDGTRVPGNTALGGRERHARLREIHAAYHAAIATELAQRRAAGRSAILVSLHSFTPRLTGGTERPWHVGVLHNGGADGFARSLLATLSRTGDTVVGDNEPYQMNDIDYTVPLHAIEAGLPYAEIEVRQDLLATPEAIRDRAAILAAALEGALHGAGLGGRG